jgi:uncharacterized protein (TIGR03437 family)
MARPEIVMAASGPVVVHASDFSLVSTTNPAKRGEILALFASGLGPTLPNIELGAPFPKDSLAAVGGPLQVNINGTPTEVIGAVGYPGTTDKYQVNFRLPQGTFHGQASLQLTAAWIAGPETQIAVQ